MRPREYRLGKTIEGKDTDGILTTLIEATKGTCNIWGTCLFLQQTYTPKDINQRERNVPCNRRILMRKYANLQHRMNLTLQESAQRKLKEKIGGIEIHFKNHMNNRKKKNL